MIKTVEAIVDEKGNVKLLEQVRLGVPRRALVTILDEKPVARVSETALLSEATLRGLESNGRGRSVVAPAAGALVRLVSVLRLFAEQAVSGLALESA